MSGKTFNDYKTRVLAIDSELKSTINSSPVPSAKLQTIQTNLDKLASLYLDAPYGKSLYKLYEIQAYLHFLLGRRSEAHKFILQAITIRERSYFDAEALIAQITKTKNSRLLFINKRSLKSAKKPLIAGFSWLTIGILSASLAIISHSPSYQGLTFSLLADSFGYFAMLAAIIIGAWQIYKSYTLLKNSRG